MAVPGDKCEKCHFCGKELMGNLQVFCPIGHKDPSENVCWCICSECRADFLRHAGRDEE